MTAGSGGQTGAAERPRPLLLEVLPARGVDAKPGEAGHPSFEAFTSIARRSRVGEEVSGARLP